MAGTAHGPETGPVIAVGEILWDLLPAGPRLGGTTANFAIGCARLGRPSSLISSLGADPWGDRARAVLAVIRGDGAERLSTAEIQIAAGVPTGLVEVAVGANGQPQYTIAMPAAWDEIRATPSALGTVAGARALCFGTLSQRSGTSRNAIRALIEATPVDCLRVLDANLRAPFFSDEVVGWSLAHATVAKISAEEMGAVAEAVGLPHAGLDEGEPALEAIEVCARALLARFPDLALVAVTRGPHGSLLLTPSATHAREGIPVAVVDTVGAGDAFTAGLVHAWLAGASLAAVNEVGNLCGSFVASHPGATPVFSDELLRRVDAALRS